MIALASIAFNRPRLISEQIRLLGKNLLDRFRLTVYDTSTDEKASREIAKFCVESGGTSWWRMDSPTHHEALNFAARMLPRKAPYIGFLDHDIFPIRPTTLIDKIDEAGFYGVGQRHPATGRLYLWPGFCFFSREWLAGRPLDFTGLRDGDELNDGDTGSGLWPLFVEEDWGKLFRAEHSHRPIRKPDEYGLQSWGYEQIDDWIHFTNASHWMLVPRPEERDRLLFGLLK